LPNPALTESPVPPGPEPGGGARGPHSDAPSRNAGGGKEAEDCPSP